MAEFCLDCLNRMDGTNLTKADVILDFDLCEECGEIKPCVVCYRPWTALLIRSKQEPARRRIERRKHSKH